MASLVIRTAARATCAIQVRYQSGPSKARGLEPTTAGSDGRITWSWRVGGQTVPGDWPIEIICSSGGQKSRLSATVTVAN
jgi:hypothetical protein